MEINAQLIQPIFTKSQLNEVIRALEEAAQSVFSTTVSIDELLADTLPVSIYDAIMTDVKTKKISLKDQKATGAYFTDILTLFKQVPVVTLTLSFEPTLKRLTEICAFLESALGRKAVVDIQVDPSIYAGVKIQYNGIYKNYSLHQTA